MCITSSELVPLSIGFVAFVKLAAYERHSVKILDMRNSADLYEYTYENALVLVVS